MVAGRVESVEVSLVLLRMIVLVVGVMHCVVMVSVSIDRPCDGENGEQDGKM